MTRPPSIAGLVGTWIALLALLAATCGSAFLALGRLNVAINLGIALVKALLVVFVFMRLRDEPAMVRVVALVALVTLATLAGLSATDFVLRGW